MVCVRYPALHASMRPGEDVLMAAARLLDHDAAGDDSDGGEGTACVAPAAVGASGRRVAATAAAAGEGAPASLRVLARSQAVEYLEREVAAMPIAPIE